MHDLPMTASAIDRDGPARSEPGLLETLMADPATRVLDHAAISRGCRCTLEHIESVIAKFPVDEQREMAGADGVITVDCAFCAQKFPVRLGAEVA